MLRLLVLMLMLANATYFAWTKNLLAPYGFAPVTQSEPQRMSQQIRPEAMRITVPPQAGTPPALQAASAPASAPASPTVPASATLTTTSGTSTATVSTPVASGPAECLQVGLFNEEQTVVLRDRLQSALPPNSWVLENIIEPGRWMVYMGKYSDAEALEKKRSELRRLRVSFEALNNATLEPGLSLGSFRSKTEADAQMARITKQGVRTARVLQTANEVRGQKLRLPSVDSALRPHLEAIKPLLAGKQLKPCQA